MLTHTAVFLHDDFIFKPETIDKATGLDLVISKVPSNSDSISGDLKLGWET